MGNKYKNFSQVEDDSNQDENSSNVKDSNGSPLKQGDSVQAIKNIAVKGMSDIKRGDVFKNIRLTEDDEAIECKVGKSTLVLKTCFFKKR
jgi:protein PhnA